MIARGALAVTLLATAGFVLGGCAGEAASTREAVRGQVLAAPVCPVEGTARECRPRPLRTTVDAYRAAAARSGRPERSVTTDERGRFSLELEPGDYELVARASFPGAPVRGKRVTVPRDVTAEVVLVVDSGIR